MKEAPLEKVFKGYFLENPLSKVFDLDEEKIEVEYVHGFYNDVRYVVEFDKRFRLELERRRGDNFKLEELVMKLDSQRLRVPYFRRVATMETSPRDLVIKVLYPNGQLDIYDWNFKQTTFASSKYKIILGRSQHEITFFGSDYDKKYTDKNPP